VDVTDDDDKERKRNAWSFAEDAMVDEELKRLAKLTPEELKKEAEKLGIDDAATLAITERAIAEADAAEAKEKAEAVAEAAKKAEAQAAAKAASSTPAKAAEPPPTKVVSLEERRRTRTRWSLYLVAAAMTGVAVAVGSGGVGGVSHPYSAEEEAADLRKKAFDDCSKQAFVLCQTELDDAAKLDPSGEGAAQVTQARQAIARARNAGQYDGGMP
jgi:hypothetical protein